MNQDANSQAARKCAQLGAQLTSESTIRRETQGKRGWPVETTGHSIVFVCKLHGLYSDLIKGSLVANFRYTNFWVAWQE